MSTAGQVLDISYCSALGPTDFIALGAALRDTSMFSGLRAREDRRHRGGE